jgi:hypothetical protein
MSKRIVSSAKPHPYRLPKVQDRDSHVSDWMSLGPIRPCVLFTLMLWWLFLFTLPEMLPYPAEENVVQSNRMVIVVPYLCALLIVASLYFIESRTQLWDRLSVLGKWSLLTGAYDMYTIVVWIVLIPVVVFGPKEIALALPDTSWPMGLQVFAALYTLTLPVSWGGVALYRIVRRNQGKSGDASESCRH